MSSSEQRAMRRLVGVGTFGCRLYFRLPVVVGGAGGVLLAGLVGPGRPMEDENEPMLLRLDCVFPGSCFKGFAIASEPSSTSPSSTGPNCESISGWVAAIPRALAISLCKAYFQWSFSLVIVNIFVAIKIYSLRMVGIQQQTKNGERQASYSSVSQLEIQCSSVQKREQDVHQATSRIRNTYRSCSVMSSTVSHFSKPSSLSLPRYCRSPSRSSTSTNFVINSPLLPSKQHCP